MNGQKDMKDETEFDSWGRASQSGSNTSSGHLSYGNSGGGSINDPYGMNAPYYAASMFQYATTTQTDHHNTAWSNGAPGPDMTFLTGGYGGGGDQGPTHSSGHYIDTMFGSQSNFGYNNFNFFPSGNTAGTNTGATDAFWGTNSNKQNSRMGAGGPYRSLHDDQSYYHREYEALKHVESGMSSLSLDHIKSADQFNAKPIGGAPFGSTSSSIDCNKKLDQMVNTGSGPVGQGPKKMTWASIASQPAKPQPKSLKSKMAQSTVLSTKHLPASTSTSMDSIGTWESKNGANSVVKSSVTSQVQLPTQNQHSSSSRGASSGPTTSSTGSGWATNTGRHVNRSGGSGNASGSPYIPLNSNSNTLAPVQQQNQLSVGVPSSASSATTHQSHQHHSQQQQNQHPQSQQTQPHQQLQSEGSGSLYPAHPVLDRLRVENSYNPKEIDINPKNARFFIIKSYSEDDIHRSIKYSIWCSTEHGNKRLDNAFRVQESGSKGPIYLFYSVNGSGHFCGMAQMVSSVDYNASSSVWAQDKWKGQFKVKWVYVKDVPNAQLRHIRLENNENKPVTNSRDTQEVPYEKGKAVLKIIHNFKHTTSIFDDFLHYEKRQEEEQNRRVHSSSPALTPNANANSNSTNKRQPSSSWKD